MPLLFSCAFATNSKKNHKIKIETVFVINGQTIPCQNRRLSALEQSADAPRQRKTAAGVGVVSG